MLENLTLLIRDCWQRRKKSNFCSHSCTKWKKSIQEGKCDFQYGTGIKINHEILAVISAILKTTTFFTSPFYYKTYQDNILYLFIFPTFIIQTGPKVGIQYTV